MIVALIDNGSLAPAAHRNLRTVARALTARSGIQIHAVSWQHSDRIDPGLLNGAPAWTLVPFVRAMVALGQREFVFVPFFVSAQGAIGSALRAELEALRADWGQFDFTFTAGLADGDAVAAIVIDRIRAVLADKKLVSPPVILVDHGGPSSVSASLRDELAAKIRRQLGREIGKVSATSMEGAHPPLLADLLQERPYANRNVVVAPLFLSPGRHAGPDGDIKRICEQSPAKCHLAELVGTHALVLDALATALQDSLSLHSAQALV